MAYRERDPALQIVANSRVVVQQSCESGEVAPPDSWQRSNHERPRFCRGRPLPLRGATLYAQAEPQSLSNRPGRLKSFKLASRCDMITRTLLALFDNPTFYDVRNALAIVGGGVACPRRSADVGMEPSGLLGIPDHQRWSHNPIKLIRAFAE
jgi:hypothetical protein